MKLKNKTYNGTHVIELPYPEGETFTLRAIPYRTRSHDRAAKAFAVVREAHRALTTPKAPEPIRIPRAVRRASKP